MPKETEGKCGSGRNYTLKNNGSRRVPFLVPQRTFLFLKEPFFLRVKKPSMTLRMCTEYCDYKIKVFMHFFSSLTMTVRTNGPARVTGFGTVMLPVTVLRTNIPS